jgi:hypothetical protein
MLLITTNARYKSNTTRKQEAALLDIDGRLFTHWWKIMDEVLPLVVPLLQKFDTQNNKK